MLHVRGADKLWAFKSSLEIPLLHIALRASVQTRRAHATGITALECRVAILREKKTAVQG